MNVNSIDKTYSDYNAKSISVNNTTSAELFLTALKNAFAEKPATNNSAVSGLKYSEKSECAYGIDKESGAYGIAGEENTEETRGCSNCEYKELCCYYNREEGVQSENFGAKSIPVSILRDSDERKYLEPVFNNAKHPYFGEFSSILR